MQPEVTGDLGQRIAMGGMRLHDGSVALAAVLQDGRHEECCKSGSRGRSVYPTDFAGHGQWRQSATHALREFLAAEKDLALQPQPRRRRVYAVVDELAKTRLTGIRTKVLQHRRYAQPW